MWSWRAGKAQASPIHTARDVLRQIRPDWQLVAPIQRTIGEPALINPVQRFEDSLGAWRDPTFLAPLAHVVRADEPSGLIAGIAAPVSPAADASPLPLAMAAKRTSAGMLSRRPAVQRVAAAPEPGSQPSRAASTVPAAAAAEAGAIGRMEMPPALPLPTVSDNAQGSTAGDDAPVPREVTGGLLGDAARPDGAVVSLPIPAMLDTVIPRAANAQSSGSLDGVTVSRVADTASPSTSDVSNVPDVPNVSDVPDVPDVAAATMPAARPTLAGTSTEDAPRINSVLAPTMQVDASVTGRPVARPPRRIGLGEPLPAGAAVQRAAVPLSSPYMTARMPVPATVVTRPLAESPQHMRAAPTSEPNDASTDAGPLVPVRGPVEPSSRASGNAAPPTDASPAVTLARLVGDTRPLTAAVRPVVVAQRIESAAPRSSPATGTAPQRTAPDPTRLVSGAAPAQAPPLVYGTSAAAPSPTAGQRASTGVPLSSLPLSTANWVAPSVQRVGLPPMPSAPNVTDGVTQAAETGRADVASARTAAWSAESEAGHAVGEASHTAAAAGLAVADAGHAATGTGGDPAALVAHLYDALLARLKTELRLDRERRGSLTDLWH